MSLGSKIPQQPPGLSPAQGLREELPTAPQPGILQMPPLFPQPRGNATRCYQVFYPQCGWHHEKEAGCSVSWDGILKVSVRNMNQLVHVAGILKWSEEKLEAGAAAAVSVLFLLIKVAFQGRRILLDQPLDQVPCCFLSWGV